MNFRSDNEAPVAPRILEAIGACNRGPAQAYGEDDWTARLEARFSALFERPVKVLPVATGTAGNGIALAALLPPWGTALCHSGAHIYNDECGAVELFSGGARLVPLPGENGKLDPAIVERHLAESGAHGVHEMAPAALSLTQSSEAGTVYTPDELARLAALAKEHHLGVHMDGARFANAVAALACRPADITWRAGVDLLTFGASKNGALAAEAVIAFDGEARFSELERRRKRAGHLLSKMRYLSAQLLAYLEDDLWLDLARHANRQATRFAAAVKTHPGAGLAYPVEANEVFLRLPERQLRRMQDEGCAFHLWPGAHDLARLVFTHATTDAETDALIAAFKRAAAA